jgi:hypothetical protein
MSYRRVAGKSKVVAHTRRGLEARIGPHQPPPLFLVVVPKLPLPRNGAGPDSVVIVGFTVAANALT